MSWNWPHLVYARNELLRVTDGEIDRIAFALPAQHGKQLADDTPMLTPSGWVNHGDLVPGDQVFGSDGRPTEVVWTSPKTDATFEVVFNDGASIKCHPRHEWTVYDRSCHRYRTAETGWMSLVGATHGTDDRPRFLVDWVALNPEYVPLPVEPYTLGAWLGDGTSSAPRITHAPSDTAVADEVGKFYTRTNVYTHKTTGCLTTLFGGSSKATGSLWGALRSVGVAHNKHIPGVYLYASTEQRRRLLAGLMDTDGYVYHRTHRACFSTCNKRLADDVATLVLTFGWRATVARSDPKPRPSKLGIVDKQPVYQVTFSPTGPIPCVLDRKRVAGFDVEYRRRAIVGIYPCAPAPGNCIQVAAMDGIYLAGRGLVPTHNSRGIGVPYVAWRMMREPGLRVGVGSHTQDYAEQLGRWVQRMVLRAGGQLADIRRASQWTLTNGSSFIAKGVGSSIAGQSIDLFYMDDVFGSREDADSVRTQEKVYEWYQDDITPRLQEKAALVFVNTRWSPGDLIGRIQQSEEWPEWVYVRIPAIAETQEERDANNNSQGLPVGAPDPVNRVPGAPLCEQRFSLAKLLQKQRIEGVGFDGLYQQNPIPRGGTFFERRWFLGSDGKPLVKSLEELPLLSPLPYGRRLVRYYDLASSRHDSACYTAGVLLMKLNDGEFAEYWVCDVVRGRWMPAERNEMMRKIAEQDALIPGFEKTWFESPVFDKNKAAARAIYAALAGFPVSGDNVSSQGSKELRAEPVAGAAKGGLLKCVDGKWLSAFLNEIESFPRSTYKDQTDSLSGGYNRLSRGGFAAAVG